MKYIKKYLPILPFLLLTLIIFLFVITPFAHDGFFATFDDVQVLRIAEMHNELLGGQFPVRLASNLGNGAGYWLFNFYPPFVYYMGATFVAVGFTFIKATKLVFILGYLLAGAGSFLFFKKLSNIRLACLVTGLYLLLPFLNYEVFIRGSLGEFFAFAMLPLLFWAFLINKENQTSQSVVLSAVLYSSVILAHTFVGFFVTFFLVLFILIFSNTKKAFIYSVCAMIGGLFLSMFFLLPLYFEQPLTIYSKNYFAIQAYKTNFLNILQLTGIDAPKWSFLPPALGVGISIFTVVSVIFLLITKRNNKLDKWLIFSLISLLLCVFLVTPYSNFLWNNLSVLRYMQFPWRFLGFISFFSIIIITLFLKKINKWFSYLFFILIVFLLFLFNYPQNYRPKTYNYIDRYYAEDTCGTSTWAQEYLPIWVESCILQSKTHIPLTPLVKVKDNRISIKHIKIEENGRKISLDKSGPSGLIIIRRYYFPGWKAKTYTEKNLAIAPSSKTGLLEIKVPTGNQKILIYLEDSPVRKFANILSLVSIVVILGLLLKDLFDKFLKKKVSYK